MLLLYLFVLVLALLSSWLILWQTPFLSKKRVEIPAGTTLSIIVPARNEEKNLSILLESLAGQTFTPLEVIVVDDDSTDQTAKVATAYGATVVTRKDQEEKWVGKSAGCWYGAQKAAGDYLLFLDADTFLPHRASLEMIMSHYRTLGANGALSIQPYHTIKKPYENLSALFNIIILAGMNRFSLLKDRLEPAGAFGPSLLCERKAYFTIGGHKKVRDSIMENIDLGRVFVENGLPLHLNAGKNALHMRMYPEGLRSLIEGWTKSFASGSQATHPLILVGISLWIAGAFFAFIFPFYFWMTGDGMALLLSVIGYLLFFFHFFRMARIAGNFHGLALLFFPILFIGFVGLFIWSLVKTFFVREVSWKGRNIRT